MDKAIVVSSISVIVSFFALGWNFYRDVVLKSRIKGSISLVHIYHGGQALGPYINLQYVNIGPGKIHIESIYMAQRPIFRFIPKLIRKALSIQPRFAHIMWDFTNDYSTKLPCVLDVGEKATLLLNSNQDAFLAVNPSHVGVTDSFGRFHWVSGSSLAAAKSEYFEDYEEKPWGES